MTYTNSQIAELIKEYIHDKTDRKILYYRFVDNDTLDEIAGKVGLDRTTLPAKDPKERKGTVLSHPGLKNARDFFTYNPQQNETRCRCHADDTGICFCENNGRKRRCEHDEFEDQISEKVPQKHHQTDKRHRNER